MAGSGKVLVSERDLAQRVHRELRYCGEALRKTRERWVPDLGDYYTIDLNTNVIVRKCWGLEGLGQYLGVLRPWETVG